jgi:DNA invertase Pin-like site-specific DNA recombinase
MRSRRVRADLTGPVSPTFKWGIYVRISDDRTEDERGVRRQEDDARERITQRGGSVTGIYAENDTSAYKKRRVSLTDEAGNQFQAYRVIRPVFKRLIDDLRTGAVDGAMVYDLDRLARDPRDLEDCVEMVEHFHRVVESTTPGQVDLTDSNGIVMARVVIAMASKASADTGRRVERAHYELARSGRPAGGRRPFGWEDDKVTLNPLEAEMVRDAVRRVLEGQRLHTISALWNASGVQTPRGKSAWTRSTLIQILTNARLCGLRTYHDKVMFGDDGLPVQGTWEPLISVDDWQAIHAILPRKSERNSRSNAPGGTGRKYLWSGFLRCGRPTDDGGICGTGMYGYPRAKPPAFAYACRPKSDGGCGSLSVSGLHVDAYLTELVLTALERIRVQEPALDADTSAQDHEANELRLRLAELGDAYADAERQIDTAEYLRLSLRMRDRINDLERERQKAFRLRDRHSTSDADWRSRWLDFDLDQKRLAISDARLEAVIVRPAASQFVNRFDPNRLQPQWQEAPT